MKDYKSYMDRVKVSEELHRKLLSPEGTRKPSPRPVWLRYAAACAAVLVGVGIWRYAALGPRVPQTDDPAAAVDSELAAIDLAPVGPDDAEPGTETIPGYEVRETVGGAEIVSYHVLPRIDYGTESNAAETAFDWGLPEGAAQRDLTADEITALLGGADAVDTHLDWSAYELTGWAAWYENGSFWGAYLRGDRGPLDCFEFAFTAGQLPPTCIVFGGSVEQEIWNITITADKFDGSHSCARRVSFMKDDYGYRFDLTGTDAEQAERLVSRLVAYIATGAGPDLAFVGGAPAAACPLPLIGYGEQGAEVTTASVAVPEDCTRRDLTQDDILALLGGEEAPDLLPSLTDLELSGSVFHHADGRVWNLDLWGEGERYAFSLFLAPDQLPPACMIAPTDCITRVLGVEVAGRKGGAVYGRGENREVWMPESREVAFVANGVGYRFRLYGTEGDGDGVEAIVSCFVRYAILEGLNLSDVAPASAQSSPSAEP